MIEKEFAALKPSGSVLEHVADHARPAKPMTRAVRER